MISPCIGDVNAEVSMADDNHGHSHSDEDGCTPFCSCACCGSMLVIPSINQLDVSKVYLSASYQIHYKFDYCFDFSLVNWHPPTLS